MAAMEDNFPSELNDRLTAFDDALTNVDSVLQTLHGISLSEVHEKLTPLDKARLDIVGAYAMNSLFWMYLNAKGENPKEHGVKQELDRVRRYMDRVKEVHDKLEEKKNQPKIDKGASKRFIRNALWQAAQSKSNQDATEQPGSSTQEVESGPTAQRASTTKRPVEESTQGEPKKKKKKKKKGPKQ